MDPLERKVLLERKKQLLVKKAILRKEYGLYYYRPYILKDGSPGPQDKFHRAGAFKHRLWECGNKGGKTHGGTAEDCAHLIGERVWYPESDPARKLGIPQKPNAGLIIAQDWEQVGENFSKETSDSKTTGRLWQLLPRGFVKHKKRNHSGVINHIECINGSVLRFDTVKSFMSDPGSAEEIDHDFIHIDVPCPELMYKGHARGLIPTDGKDWFNLTMLKEPWIHDMFFPSRRSKEDTVIFGNKWAHRSNTYDNTTLSVEAIKDFEDTLTEDERQCRIHGIPLELSGLVFKEFDWEAHVLSAIPNGWKNFNDPPFHYTIYYAIDPHPQTPHHVLFLAAAPTGELFLYDEIYVHNTIEELSEMINARLMVGGRSRFCVRQIADPKVFETFPVLNAKSGKHISMADEFSDNGIFLSKASKARAHAILETQRALLARLLGGRPIINVSPYLTETLFEFGHWCWDTKENKPRDERDHAMENLGRLLLEEPKWIDSNSNASFTVPEMTFEKPELELEDLDFNLD